MWYCNLNETDIFAINPSFLFFVVVKLVILIVAESIIDDLS